MNHYPRHVGDYLRDTVGLTMLEDGAYTRLLDQYYARNAPLPAAKATIYRIARAVSKAERAAVDLVLAQFFVPSQDGWRNKRADMELQAQSERSASARESAKHRWDSEHANAVRTHMQTNSEGNAESMLASSQKPLTKKENQELGGFPEAKPKNGNHAKNLGTRLPEGWFLPDEWKVWAITYRTEWDEERVLRESLVFRDYWHAKPGKDARKADWLATWRNWVRRAI